MPRDWYDRDLVERSNLFLRTNQNHLGRPIFIFCCGGDPKKYPARNELKRYIDASKLQELSNVFCSTRKRLQKSPFLTIWIY